MNYLHPEPTEIPENEFEEAVEAKISCFNDDFKNAISRHKDGFIYLEALVALHRRGVRDTGEILEAAENLAGAIIEELEENVKADYGY